MKPPALRLRLNGMLSVRDGEGRAVEGLSRRAQAMLAYLSTQPDMQAERGLLADLLWSDRAEAQARASLRQELSVMRRILPEGLMTASRQSVSLDPARIVVEPGPGTLLEGFDLPSEAFEDWLRTMRNADVPQPAAAPPAIPASNTPTLAVMPFEELGAPEADMFADGVVEEITSALSRNRDFDTIARQSAFALRGLALPVPEIAAKLGADYVVEGSVRRSGDRVRISVQLIRGADGHTIWSERLDDRQDDLFDLQDRVAALVAGQVSPHLRSAEIARIGRVRAEDRTAYELTLSALPLFWASRKDSIEAAIRILDQAIAREPTHAPALAYKAWAVAHMPTYMWSDDPLGDHERALELAETAALHAEDHPPTLVAIGATFAFSSTDAAIGNHFIDRALEIDPNNAWGWLRRGWSHVAAGRGPEVLPPLDRADQLSPLDPFRFSSLVARGSAYRIMGDYDTALAYHRQAMRENPQAPWIRRTMLLTLLGADRMDEARAEVQLLLQSYPGLTLTRFQQSFPRTFWEGNEQHADRIRMIGLAED
ncbi:tetratricopeptide repeat protein [Oceanicola sp. 22II-s10i]|uniref:tetratricopeptide repeat protein n=1 Tax=Oceanicola sp. 22II-s10i TaxID=1317116 RepID=UPI001132716B|nr:tetratricopeptide repeat protein [Oceanicola sp. 22II-s10i]